MRMLSWQKVAPFTVYCIEREWSKKEKIAWELCTPLLTLETFSFANSRDIIIVKNQCVSTHSNIELVGLLKKRKMKYNMMTKL